MQYPKPDKPAKGGQAGAVEKGVRCKSQIINKIQISMPKSQTRSKAI